MVSGVNANLLAAGTTSINITQDTTSATTNVQAFVTQFNTITDLLDSYTKYQSSQLQMMRLGMTMARKMLVPDKADGGSIQTGH